MRIARNRGDKPLVPLSVAFTGRDLLKTELDTPKKFVIGDVSMDEVGAIQCLIRTGDANGLPTDMEKIEKWRACPDLDW